MRSVWDSFLGPEDGVNRSEESKPFSQSAHSIRDLIGSVADKYGVPREIALSLANVESSLNPKALGPETRWGRAQGLYQIMPAFKQDYGVTDGFNPEDNANGALRTLRARYEKYGSWDKAIAAHHAGEGAVDRAGGIPNTADVNMRTGDYVRRVMENAGSDFKDPAPAKAGGSVWDSFLNEKPAPLPDTSSDSVRGLKDAALQLGSGAMGAGAFVADRLGVLGARDELLGIVAKNNETIQARSKPTDQFTTILENKGSGLGSWLAYNFSNVMAQFAPSIAAGGVGYLAGRHLAKEGVEQAVEQQMKAAMARELAAGKPLDAATAVANKEAKDALTEMLLNRAGVKGAAAAGFTQNTAQELGEIYPEAVEEGNPDPGRVLGSALAAGAVDTAGEAFLARGAFKAARGGFGQRLGTKVGAGGTVEAGVETVQTGIERYGAGKDLTSEEAKKEYINSAAVGGLGGGAISIPGAFRQAEDDAPVLPPGVKTAGEAATAEEAATLPITPIQVPPEGIKTASQATSADEAATLPITPIATPEARLESPLADLQSKANKKGELDDPADIIVAKMMQAAELDLIMIRQNAEHPLGAPKPPEPLTGVDALNDAEIVKKMAAVPPTLAGDYAKLTAKIPESPPSTPGAQKTETNPGINSLELNGELSQGQQLNKNDELPSVTAALDGGIGARAREAMREEVRAMREKIVGANADGQPVIQPDVPRTVDGKFSTPAVTEVPGGTDGTATGSTALAPDGRRDGREDHLADGSSGLAGVPEQAALGEAPGAAGGATAPVGRDAQVQPVPQPDQRDETLAKEPDALDALLVPPPTPGPLLNDVEAVVWAPETTIERLQGVLAQVNKNFLGTPKKDKATRDKWDERRRALESYIQQKQKQADMLKEPAPDLLKERINSDLAKFAAEWDAMDYGKRQAIAEVAYAGMRKVVHRIAGSKWAQLGDDGERASIRQAMREAAEKRSRPPAEPDALPDLDPDKLKGRTIEIDVAVGDTGVTTKMFMDAGEAVRDVRTRLRSARELLRCLQ